MTKRFSQAAENNQEPILQQLTQYFATRATVLEIGSGTGQHAVHLARGLSHLVWCPSDLLNNLSGIAAWISEAALSNIIDPIEYNAALDEWPLAVDAVYSANTAHIMQANEVAIMMSEISKNLPVDGIFAQYGPFKMNGRCTTASNVAFNQRLLQQGYGGIRDIAELEKWAGTELQLQERIEMPANNFLLIWQKW
ncbi:DUF938 domain-containing protein [Flocculibacter collagenilyticus]|uniref:DUF938 domain-containing protein n=1 Tax=Flocculibacter collagenilyticus TaxID=2744479 RepID=UPI0018F695F2|nr:DUF938 domain-containing protein [Flocculibacter collagenilyticus]